MQMAPALAEAISLQSRGDRIRTCDLVDPNHTRYQAALHPGCKMSGNASRIVRQGNQLGAGRFAASDRQISAGYSNFAFSGGNCGLASRYTLSPRVPASLSGPGE